MASVIQSAISAIRNKASEMFNDDKGWIRGGKFTPVKQIQSIQQQAPAQTFGPLVLPNFQNKQIQQVYKPIVPYAKKFGEGFGESSTYGLVDIPNAPSQNLGEKVAYGAGYVGGMINPLNPINKVMGALNIGGKVVSAVAPRLATRAAGRIVGGLGSELAQTAAYTGAKYLAGKTGLREDTPITPKSVLTDLAFGSVLRGAPAAVSGVISKGVTTKAKTMFELKKPLDSYEKNMIESMADLWQRQKDITAKDHIFLNDLMVDKLGVKRSVAESLTPVQKINELLTHKLQAEPGFNGIGLVDQSKRLKIRTPEQLAVENVKKANLATQEVGTLPKTLSQTEPLKVAYQTLRSPSLEGNIPQDPVQKIMRALKEAKPLRGQQEAIYRQQRAIRAARAASMGERVAGEKGYFAQLGQLKGEMPKVQFESLRNSLTQTDIDSLFNKVETSALPVFDKITAKTALAKLMGAEGGTVPTRGELKLLGEIFPPEFIQSVLDKRPLMQKLWSGAEQVLNLPQSMMSTLDLSAPLRQGALLVGRPKQWIPAFRDMFKYVGSEKAYKGLQENIRSRPTYNAMREAKLAITDIGPDILGREEAFLSNLSEKIPIFGKLSKASNRAYSGFLNKLRADTFDDLLAKSKELGVYDQNPGIINDIAKFVNTATGRGDLGALNKAAPILNAAFFSPRLMASRVQTLNPMYYVNLDPFVRKEALKSLFGFGTVVGTILGLSKLGGAEVSTDPRSADFGKIKIGDTRYDPWGGFQQYLVLASRLVTGEMVSSTTGKEFKLGEGYKPTTRFDIVQRFFESKESPIASFVTSLFKGQTNMGEPVNVPAEIVDRFIPMMAQDVTDLYKEYGAKGIPMAIPGIFGVGSQTYTDQIPMKGKTPTGKENIQWRTQPGLGEQLVNKITGTQLSNIPQDQWAPLVEERKQKALKAIDMTKAKATVLETGESQVVDNTLIYMKDGVVKTKDITPKSTTTKVPATKKLTVKKAKKPKKIKISTPKKIKIKKLAAIKIKKPSKLKLSFKKTKPIALKMPKFKKIKLKPSKVA